MHARLPIIWSAEAEADLEAIHAYIARSSPRYAAIVGGRLIDSVTRLGDFPDSGRMVPELGDPQVREVIEGAYRIVYERQPTRVEILTVFRGSRMFPLDLRVGR
jgi:plasmid stabilization system protein ParE